jgi:hypothetical protein
MILTSLESQMETRVLYNVKMGTEFSMLAGKFCINVLLFFHTNFAAIFAPCSQILSGAHAISSCFCFSG